MIAAALESIVLLLWLGVQLAGGARLAKPGSTHPSFPTDAFAKPTFQLIYDDSNPISNHTALEMLRAFNQDRSETRAHTDVSEYQTNNQDAKGEAEKGPFKLYLHRTSTSTLHLCSIPHPKPKPKKTLHLNESSLKDHRSRIVENALQLLSPLKETCLFHTMDWFTYSLCYGDAIKQFRALPLSTTGLGTPAMDPTQDSYVLGRWNDKIEAFKQGEPSTDLQIHEAGSNHQGTELMELVHFSSLGSSDSDQGISEEDSQIQAQATVEGKGRYISQVWTDGTRCIINNELRSTEVQFHCSKTPARDRISLIKEVTTCNYVVVVDTPRLCEEPALAQVEDEVREVRCQPIVSEEELQRRYRAAATIEGGKSKTSGTLSKQEVEKVVQPDKKEQQEEVKKGREGVKASIESMVNRINAAIGDSASEVEVIIGWDEEGKFIIEPKKDQAMDVDRLLDQGVQAGESKSGNADETKTGTKTKDKWDILMEKLLDLEDEITEAADVESQWASDQVGLDEGSEQKMQEGTAGQEPVKAPPTLQATETVADNAPVRTNQMAREKENFAQRVERFYKAQEAQKQREEEAAARHKSSSGAGEGEQPHVARGRDEL